MVVQIRPVPQIKTNSPQARPAVNGAELPAFGIPTGLMDGPEPAETGDCAKYVDSQSRTQSDPDCVRAAKCKPVMVAGIVQGAIGIRGALVGVGVIAGIVGSHVRGTNSDLVSNQS